MSECITEPRDKLCERADIARIFAADDRVREPEPGYFFRSASEASTCATMQVAPLVEAAAQIDAAIASVRKLVRKGSHDFEPALGCLRAALDDIAEPLSRYSEYEAWLQREWDERAGA